MGKWGTKQSPIAAGIKEGDSHMRLKTLMGQCVYIGSSYKWKRQFPSCIAFTVPLHACV